MSFAWELAGHLSTLERWQGLPLHHMFCFALFSFLFFHLLNNSFYNVLLLITFFFLNLDPKFSCLYSSFPLPPSHGGWDGGK